LLVLSETSYLHRTRAAYDAVADDYAGTYDGELVDRPLDRALLAAFAELVQAGGGGPVADIGSGPGYVTAHLHALGLTTFGIDLSPRMVALARQAHPDLRFYEGSMTALDLPDAILGGIVAMYSIIHTPLDQLPLVFAEFHRVLAPGGRLLLVFQLRDQPRHATEWFGHAVSLDGNALSPDQAVELLDRAGFAVHARLVREPDGGETVPRAYLLARRQRESPQGTVV
jgi:SAM-dependent methyltransferase